MTKKEHSTRKTPSKIQAYLNILQLGFSGLLEVTSPAVRSSFTAPGTFKKIVRIASRFFVLPFKAIYYRFKYSSQRDYHRLSDVPCLLITSKNNKDVLERIKKKDPSAVYLSYEGYVSSPEDLVPLWHFSIWLRLFTFPWVLWRFYTVYGKRAFRYADYVFKGVGQYESALTFLKKYRPKYIIFANDHSVFPRAVLEAAKQLSIPTIYVQHASVTPYFPPLDFDLNLLEGQATYDQYLKNGPIPGECKLVGMPKFDAFIDFRNQSSSVQKVGICTNKMDNKDDVEQFIEELSNLFPSIEFTFRPHPADNTPFIIPKNVQRSTKDELVFDFLKNQDLIIAGNTSTHLEAILLNVESIYYEFSPTSKELRDMYGYCRNGLTEHAKDFEELRSIIHQNYSSKKTDIYKRAQYYNATVGTKNEGKSADLVTKEIDLFIQKWYNTSHNDMP